MSIKYLSSSGLTEVWSNIKTYIASKIPSKIVTGLSIKGRTITYTNSDGTTGTLTTQDTNTTYSVATTSTNGLMSSTDKTKLDGIATGANNYTHPSSHPASMITGLTKVATSGSYNDLTNKPTIPTVNNATLTIQKNGTTVKTFTANASTNVTANITVPTKTSELTNNSGFLTSHNPVDSSLSSTSTNAIQNKVVNAALNNKANDNSVVHRSGDETITGTKTFSSQIKGNISGSSTNVVVGSDTATARGYLVDGNLPWYKWEEGSQLIAGRVPLITDFNNLTKPGVYHVVFCLNDGFVHEEKEYKESLNRPSIPGPTTGFRDGILEIKKTSTMHTISSFNRVTQKITLLSGAPTSSYIGLTYQRVFSPHGVWTAWKRVARDEEVVHNTGNETISGTKTFSNVIFSNKELAYKDTKYDWTNTSLDTWCDAGHVSWSDKTGNRRMHELVGTKGGVWRKACYINEKQYFNVDSNRNITYWGTTTIFYGTTGFTGNVICNGTSYLKMTDLENSTTPPTSARYKHINVVANDGSLVGDIQFCKRADGSFDTTIYSVVGSSNEGTLRVASNNAVYPLNNKTKLGISSFKWSEVWANTFNGNSVKCTDGNAFMAQKGGYTFLIRNDGSNTYFLMSDKDGTPGTWSTARPLIINNVTGVCSINGNANTATNATYTNWLRASSHADHLFHTEWDGKYFWTYVTAGDGGYRAVRVARSDSAGTADTATKATQDSAGQQINTTYIKSVSVNGRTITFTRGNGTTFAITIYDNVVINALANSFGSTGVGGICFVSGRTKNNIGGLGADVAGSDIHLVHWFGFQVFKSDDRVDMGIDYDTVLSGTWRLLGSVGDVDYKRWTLAIRIA